MGRSVVTTGEHGARRRWVTALLAAPAVAAALGLCGIEAWRMLHPRSPLFAPPFAYSLADAIATGNVLHGYEYIRAGQDPNEPIAVRHPALTRNRWVFASPVAWAVATNQRDAVNMLLGHGARLDGSALCLAEGLGHEDIARVLRMNGGTAVAAACDPRQMYPFER